MYALEEMTDRIKQIKKQKGLTNEKLAEISGIPLGTLSKILGSETKDPQISNIIKIAQALGVSSDYIILGTLDTNLHSQKASLAVDVKELVECYQLCDVEDKEELSLYINNLQCLVQTPSSLSTYPHGHSSQLSGVLYNSAIAFTVSLLLCAFHCCFLFRSIVL